MKRNNDKWLIAGCIGLMLVVSLVLYPSLPHDLPTHWNFSGEVDDTAPKLVVVLMLPALAALVSVALAIAPQIDPRREAYEKFAPSYNRIRVAVVVFMLGLHVLLLTQYDNPQAVVKLILFGVALLFAVIGNEMGRFRQTWFVGIRTPWTLADERVWRKTHRVGARYFFGVGVLNMVTVLLLPLPVAGVILIVSAVGISMGLSAYSYFVYRQINTV